MVCFPIGHVAVGVALTYSTLCAFVNRSVLTVSGGILTIKHQPLPWLGNQSLAGADVEQIYCTEKLGRNPNSAGIQYIVNAKLKNGRQTKLLSGLVERDQALYIEQKLEEKLGIVDVPVGGEMER